MRKEDVMFKELSDFAKSNKNIRAILLTSSRANLNAYKDVFTDFDIELFVNDLQPFITTDKWLDLFGKMVICLPLKPVENEGWITRLVLFEDGTKIDFQISTTKTLMELSNKRKLPPEYDNGYKVLLDKDNLTKKMTSPSYTAFVTQKPSEEEFYELMNDFWWDTTYVAKSLWRDELFFVKFMLDNVIRFNYLQKVIEWYIGVQNDWNVNPNKCGRCFKRFLDKETWEELESTYVGADIEDNWNALFRTADLFSRLSVYISNQLSYKYPVEIENKIRDYLLKTRKLDKNSTTFI